MNIITNKEVFSEENQANIPKKVPRRPSRPRKPAGSSTPAPTPTSAPQENKDATPTAEGQKTVFYQASKPRTDQPRPARRPLSGITPSNRGVANRTPQERAPQPERAPQSDRPSQPRPQQDRAPQAPRPNGGGNGFNNRNVGQGGRFQTASRRPDRGRFPQDNAGVFIQRDGQVQEFSNPTPRSNSAEKLKIIPLGGLEEIGKNMTLLEYGNDILIIDMGFMFPDADMPGIDYIIPDVTYLEGKKENIRGAIITHGHLDHTGAIPYLMPRL
ncbi:MAG: rnj, partial [Patescibacteria group bacterium]|nr:rnj [Patescibacteria group bacterium]